MYFFPFFIVFVKDSIPGNWLQKRAPEARGKSSPKRERRRREILPEAQEIPRSGETNSQFLALNFCKAHTSSISCSYLVCDTDYLLLCVGKFFFHLTRTSFFFFSSHVGQVFFPFYVWVKFFFFYLWVGQVFFLQKLPAPPLKSNGASLKRHWTHITSSPTFFPKRWDFYTISSVGMAWVMTACWVLRSRLIYFWRNINIYSIFYFSKLTSINTQYSSLWTLWRWCCSQNTS